MTGWEEGVKDVVDGGTVNNVLEQVGELTLAIKGGTHNGVPEQVLELALAALGGTVDDIPK